SRLSLQPIFEKRSEPLQQRRAMRANQNHMINTFSFPVSFSDKTVYQTGDTLGKSKSCGIKKPAVCRTAG
ncbi:MAG: hypothetical protein ACI4SZ_03235, partial [Lachnospiraceae bacterium]